MSLRARLIVGLLALAAVGLVALAAVTYAEQRNFLYDRVDDQTKAAVGFGDRGPIAALGGGGYDHDPGGPPDGDRGPGGGPPVGTWLFLRDASGNVTRSFSASPYTTT